MPAKKEDEFEQDDAEDIEEEKTKSPLSIGMSTIITGIIFIIIAEAFFYLLSTKAEAVFGVTEIIFGLIVAVTITLFLLWIKFIMRSNRYLGTIIGIAGTGAMVYALSTQFKGAYTNTFIIISAIVSLGYIFMHFWKSQSPSRVTAR